jgi:hypothetical protein
MAPTSFGNGGPAAGNATGGWSVCLYWCAGNSTSLSSVAGVSPALVVLEPLSIPMEG